MKTLPSIKNMVQLIDRVVKSRNIADMDWQYFGNVSVSRFEDYILFNYTKQAQIERRWNWFERVSRGLIINCVTGEIVARPYDKFFNWGELEGCETDAPITRITQKMDGSLGVLYRYQVDGETQYRIATRGSFYSPQAIWATEHLNQNHDLTGLPNKLTLLFEIVYPANRIITDYGDYEGLILLDARDRFTGHYIGQPTLNDMAYVYNFRQPSYTAFSEEYIPEDVINWCHGLTADNEGYVVHFDDGSIFKFKSLAYMKLAKVLQGLTFKHVFKAYQEGGLTELILSLPDEPHFRGRARGWVTMINNTVHEITLHVEEIIFDAEIASVTDDRKRFALWLNEHHPSYMHYVFAQIDGKDLKAMILKNTDWKQEIQRLENSESVVRESIQSTSEIDKDDKPPKQKTKKARIIESIAKQTEPFSAYSISRKVGCSASWVDTIINVHFHGNILFYKWRNMKIFFPLSWEPKQRHAHLKNATHITDDKIHRLGE